jgi:hypothetical protein
MIEIALVGLLAAAELSPPPTRPEPMIQEVQFRAGPGGQCPDGFAYNFSDGYCYRNGRQPPGVYAPPDPPRYGRGSHNRPQYGDQGGGCPDGFAFNYSDGRCYRNGRQPPGLYAR